jgi:hypothetical protein
MPSNTLHPVPPSEYDGPIWNRRNLCQFSQHGLVFGLGILRRHGRSMYLPHQYGPAVFSEKILTKWAWIVHKCIRDTFCGTWRYTWIRTNALYVRPKTCRAPQVQHSMIMADNVVRQYVRILVLHIRQKSEQWISFLRKWRWRLNTKLMLRPGKDEQRQTWRSYLIFCGVKKCWLIFDGFFKLLLRLFEWEHSSR